ncbi:MAG: Stp1/IreP family PP2C-type Ser/Thr phosphatase [Ktedonobacteraceae bacterium]|nr:Stp1/IreP family PP2C-type Ser/Thr phosphatase [Ktedonobacteraceae bacterium]
MSKQLRLDVAQLTDVGRKRPHNEDNMAYVIPKDPQVMARKGALFIVADGMGGHAAGEVASEIAVDTVSYSYYQDDSEDVATSLLHAIKRANSLIHQRAAENMLRSGMGTTCVAAVLRGGVAYIANVGDSRAYLMRHGYAKQVSQDHSWVAEQVRAGLLTEDQARSHAQRNVITRCLGTQSEVDVDVFTEQLEEGDSLILCTDGLSGLVGDEELRVIVDQFVPQESVYHLVERANENGGPDNITAIVIRVQEVGWEPPSARYPVRVGGGPEIGGDAALLGRLPSTPLLSPMQTDGFRAPGVGFNNPTNPFFSPDTITAPQPAVKTGSSRKNRLFYPTALLLVFLVVAVIGSSLYLFLRMRGNIIDIDATLSAANVSIAQAQEDVNATPANPMNALQELTVARAKLVSIQNSSRNGSQNTQYTHLSSALTTTVKQAITSYNRLYNIASLPCVATASTGITAAITKYGNMAVFNDAAGKKQFYVLADDKQLHALNGQQLGNGIAVGGANTTVEAIATDGTRLIALVSLPDKGYQLSMLQPQNNSLRQVTTADVAAPTGYIPSFIALANNTVSVVLIQTGSTQPQIANYAIAGTGNGQHFNTPTKTMISISNTIVSVAALSIAQKTHLFFLLSTGLIQSLQLNNGASLIPGSVQISPSIPAPLAVSAANFTDVQNPVPTPASKVIPSLTALSVVGATQLVTGPKDLYIVAAGVNGVSPRILDLTVPSSTTGKAGGGVAPATDTTLYMTLTQQYAISLPTVKSVALDPKGTGFYMLALTGQNAATSQLVSVTLPLEKTCIS